MEKRKHKRILGAVLFLLPLLLLAGCGQGSGQESAVPQINGLTYMETVETEDAEGFTIYRYEGGFDLIDVHEDARYLVVPQGGDIPEDLPEDLVIIQKDLKNIYQGATASMALLDAIGALDQVTMTEMKESGWVSDHVTKAMREGSIVYAGKYSEPDYELILSKNCDLAVESTMIYHDPEVKEMLEKLGIPVFVDRSSYEADPLGRTEWVKVYGVLTGHEKEAEAFYQKQKEALKDLEGLKNTEKSVAFFYVTSTGKVVVRSSSDYIPAMIEMAGGRYAFGSLEDDKGKSSVSMTWESFYEGASEADYLVYNTNIDNTVKSMEDLLAKSDALKSFKAVREGNCFLSGKAFYQRTDEISTMILDFHKMVMDEDPSDMKYLEKLE